MKPKSHRTARQSRVRTCDVEHLEARCLLASDVYIAEFMASNDQTLFDSDGDTSDWIEVFNAGPDDINLEGWYLTDSNDSLDKWSFPDQELAAGTSLIVFASGKDRAATGEELHAGFKLSAGGEYLALTRNDGATQVVISEFRPEYPQQIADVSYGAAQQSSITELVSTGSTAKLLIPNQQPDDAWTTIGYDDASWQTVTGPSVGYQQTISGFTVEMAKSESRIRNLSEAESVLDGNGQVSKTVAVSPFIDFFDAEGGDASGRFDNDLKFPGDTSGDDNDFAIRATGTITIPSTGLWSFATNSDDGSRLRIDGQLVIDDDTLHAPQDRFGVIELDAGFHRLEFVYFERGGGAEVELSAARGELPSFSSRFDLIGDTAAGGLKVETSPSGDAVGFSKLIGTNVGEEMLGNATSAFLRIPFEVTDPADLESLSLHVSYDDGFVAYLNGQEVARRNVSGMPSFDSTADSDRLALNALSGEYISISEHLSLLKSGDNVLSIQALNDTANSNEFLIATRLQEVAVAAGQLGYFRQPTPGEFNTTESIQEFLLDDISFSQSHGFYDRPFDLSVSSETAGTTIRYTTDGSLPTETNGIDYQGPIRVEKTSTIRARSFKDGLEPSTAATVTYLFLADVVKQSPTGIAPEGWPTSRNINSQSLDYGIDPDIVNHPTWGPQLEEALTQIPSMSVVMDIDDFVGSRQGIYTHARSHGRAWERPASLELINPDGSDGFQVNMGIRIRGGFSRTGNNPKHAFRLFFRDEYGDSKLEYPLFGDEGVEQFDKLDLRTTQNYSWSFQGDGRNTFLRDIFSRDAQRQMGQPYTRGRYYHLYINGQYWGLYQSEERPEARYAASYFGGVPDDYDVVKSAGSTGGYENEATDGNLNAYRRLSEFFYATGGLGDGNMSEYYRAQGLNQDGTRNPEFERLLDVDNLIDYMILTYFTSDADGPGSKFTRPRVNNYFTTYNRVEPDGFKFFEHDSEHSLDTGNAAGANYNMVTPLTTGGRQFRYFNPHWMHEQLAKTNTEYRQQFADRVYEQLFHDGVLSVENANALIDSRAAEFDMAMVAESARWGDAKRNSPLTKTNWEQAVRNLRSFFDDRAETVLRQLRSQDWFPDSNPPQFAVNNTPQHGGEITSNDVITLNTPTNFTYSTILRRGATWKYLDDGSNQRAAWRAIDFDDSSWESGRAQLGYGNNGERTELSFGGDSNNKHPTTYFRNKFNVNNPEEFQAGLLRLVRDDGAIVYLNGEEIARSNMPSGRINYRTFAPGTVGGAEESEFFEIDFPAGLMRSGENTLAVEIHQRSASSSDISFDLELRLGKAGATADDVYYTVDGTDPKLLNGDVSPTAIRYHGNIRLVSDAIVSVRSLVGGAWSVLNSAPFSVMGGILGDFSADGIVNAEDIDLLAAATRSDRAEAIFDMDGSGSVDDDDITFLVEEVLGTRRGDTNLDGKVGFDDFLALAANFGNSSVGWEDGDFDTDDEVSFQDFLTLAENFGYQRPDV